MLGAPVKIGSSYMFRSSNAFLIGVAGFKSLSSQRETNMREEKTVLHLSDPVPGIRADLELRRLIATKRDERETWGTIRADIERCKNRDGYCPRIIEEPPFNGRIILIPAPSSECPEFYVVTPQGFRLIFRGPEENKCGLSLDWGFPGKGYAGCLASSTDEQYLFTLLSVDRKRSLFIKTREETVKDKLLKALSVSQSNFKAKKQTKKHERQLEGTVRCSETLSIQASDPTGVIETLTSYSSYLDDVDADTCRNLIEAVNLRTNPVLGICDSILNVADRY